MSNRLEQTQNYLADSWQSLTAIQNNTSAVIETTIYHQLNDFVTQYPTIVNIIQFINWVVIHPIISFILILLILAVLWSIVKGIVRVIEKESSQLVGQELNSCLQKQNRSIIN